MRIGIFGGTFDPPHTGHLLAASDAFEALSLDRLLWVPTAQQPLKIGSQGASAADRLAMVRHAIAEDRRFEVDAIETERAGLSFTVDTLGTMAQRFPSDELVLLVGADVVASFGKWRSPRRIVELARLAILHRVADEGHVEKAALVGAIRAIAGSDLPAPIVLDTRRVDISSTEIRERVRGGRFLTGFVPDAVARFITERALYR